MYPDNTNLRQGVTRRIYKNKHPSAKSRRGDEGTLRALSLVSERWKLPGHQKRSRSSSSPQFGFGVIDVRPHAGHRMIMLRPLH